MNLGNKMSVEQIRERFDRDVKSFSKIETGQQAIMDSLLLLSIAADTVSALVPQANRILDIGCGAGNYTLKLLEVLPNANCTLVDLSQPMLDKAKERVSVKTSGQVVTVQEDMRKVDFKSGSFDVIISSMAMHHLRGDAEWEKTFEDFHEMLTKGGLLLVIDLISHVNSENEKVQKERWGKHLEDFKGKEFRDYALESSSREDSPRPLLYQIELLRKCGFREIDILHKNSVFAAYYGIK
jgi:tRNA (cmo5U34)-methyltransferase